MGKVDIEFRAESSQSSICRIKQRVCRDIIHGPEPFALEDSPQRLCDVKMRTVWRKQEKEQAETSKTEAEKKAEKASADYIGVGAVFPTSTKKDAKPMEVEQLRSISNAVSIPVVAIGGIGAGNILKLSGSGVDGVAVVSAIFGAEDPGRATAELRKLSAQMVAAHE